MARYVIQNKTTGEYLYMYHSVFGPLDSDLIQDAQEFTTEENAKAFIDSFQLNGYSVVPL